LLLLTQAARLLETSVPAAAAAAQVFAVSPPAAALAAGLEAYAA